MSEAQEIRLGEELDAEIRQEMGVYCREGEELTGAVVRGRGADGG